MMKSRQSAETLKDSVAVFFFPPCHHYPPETRDVAWPATEDLGCQ